MKGITATLVTGVFKTGQLPITGTATANSATLASVTAVTGYANGATLTGVGIPAGTTVLSGAGTTSITMSAQANSLASGTPSTIVVNQGLVYLPLGTAGALVNGFTTADTYTGEAKILWAAGGIQRVPNSFGSDFTVLVDTELA